MSPARRALVVAVDEYRDAGLSRLQAAGQDAVELAEVLGRPDVGDFDVQVLRNPGAHEVRLAVEDLFTETAPDDLLLLHFSCHGLKSASGELFLAASDTRPDRLASTAVAADFVNRQMADCSAQRVALFLDCCYGGAFPRGMVVRGSTDVHVREAFAAAQPDTGGRGRVVVTASSAVEYAFEGGELTSGDTPKPSVFTGAVVDGLRTGAADRDGDGWVGLQELFGYVSERVRDSTSHQTPHLWTFGAQGDLLLAHSGRRRVVARTLPAELVAAARDALPSTRLGVALELRDLLLGDDLPRALGAWNLLRTMQDDDSRRVCDAVTAALAAVTPTVEPASLDLVARWPGLQAQAEVEVGGPPLVRSVSVEPVEPWLEVSVAGARVAVTATADPDTVRTAAVVLTAPTGQVAVPVSVRTESRPTPAPPPEPAEPREAAAFTGPVRTPSGPRASTGRPPAFPPDHAEVTYPATGVPGHRPAPARVSTPAPARPSAPDSTRQAARPTTARTPDPGTGAGPRQPQRRLLAVSVGAWLVVAAVGALLAASDFWWVTPVGCWAVTAVALGGCAAVLAAAARPPSAPVARGVAAGCALAVVALGLYGFEELRYMGTPYVAYQAVAAAAVALQLVLVTVAVARAHPRTAPPRLRRTGAAAAGLVVAGAVAGLVQVLVPLDDKPVALAAISPVFLVAALFRVAVAGLTLVRLGGDRDRALVAAVGTFLAVDVVVHVLVVRYQQFGALAAVLLLAGVVLAARRDSAFDEPGPGQPLTAPAVRPPTM